MVQITAVGAIGVFALGLSRGQRLTGKSVEVRSVFHVMSFYADDLLLQVAGRRPGFVTSFPTTLCNPIRPHATTSPKVNT